jgi:hypothetical protein
MLAALSITDDTALAGLSVLCAVIAHLYWMGFRCRDRHETTKERLAKLENAIAACPAENCPLQKPSGAVFAPTYCILHNPPQS